METNAWKDFNDGIWKDKIDIRDFIQANYTPYEGDGKFLAGATENTKKLWDKVMQLNKEESIYSKSKQKHPRYKSL